MLAPNLDTRFAGSIPELYERYLVPLIFQAYADDLAARVAARQPGSVLEIAAGTGVVTRQLAQALPPSVPVVATDLNPAMLERAALVGTSRPVEWQQADAMQLPFPDASFDAVVCQFGAMFFPDKAQAFAEARRVLRPGGAFVFNVWDGIEHNEFADVVTESLLPMFPADPPRFLARLPHGHGAIGPMSAALVEAGFDAAHAVTTLAARSRADTADFVAVAYCQGTPLRNEIDTRDASRLDEATEAVAAALAAKFGSGAIAGRMRALVVTAR